MKTALVLAYHFPPIGGAGVQRNSKFVRYLPELGWRCHVVTGPGAATDRWTPLDLSLTEDVPDGTVVHRSPSPEPLVSTHWRLRAERWAGIRSPWLRWWERHVLAAGVALADDVDVVYASLVPFETAAVARRLARAIRKPLIVDLQDPWALDEMMIYPSALHRALEVRRMRRALAAADVVVMNTAESARRVLERFPELGRKLVVSIPNGYDAADFESPAPERPPGRPFRIVHTGYLHTELGLRQRQVALARRLLGGWIRGVDILTRSHVHLLEGIDRLLSRRPELAGRIEVHLAGVLSETDREIAARHPFVTLHGYLPHVETVSLTRSADLLFLPMHDLPAGRRIGIVPGKTYEYLGSGRPILAAVPDGDARDLLQEAGSAILCRPGDVAGLERAVEAMFDLVERGGSMPEPDPNTLERIERRALTASLAEAFERSLTPVPRRAARLPAVKPS